jgi:hypothetical protein
LCTTCSGARHTKRSRGLASLFLLFCMHIDRPPDVIIITYIFLSKSGHILLYNVIITFIFLSESGQKFLYLITSKLYTNHITYYSIKKRVSSNKNYKNVLYAEKKCYAVSAYVHEKLYANLIILHTLIIMAVYANQFKECYTNANEYVGNHTRYNL